MAQSQPVGVWFENLSDNLKQILVNDLESDEFQASARDVGFVGWDTESELANLNRFVSKWNRVRQAQGQRLTKEQWFKLHGFLQKLHKKELKQSKKQKHDKMRRHKKIIKLEDKVYNLENEREKKELQAKVDSLKAGQSISSFLNVLNLISFLFVLASYIVLFVNNSDIDGSNTRVYWIQNGIYASSILFWCIIRFYKDFVRNCLICLFCNNIEIDQSNYWKVNRLRGTVFNVSAGIISLLLVFIVPTKSGENEKNDRIDAISARIFGFFLLLCLFILSINTWIFGGIYQRCCEKNCSRCCSCCKDKVSQLIVETEYEMNNPEHSAGEFDADLDIVLENKEQPKQEIPLELNVELSGMPNAMNAPGTSLTGGSVQGAHSSQISQSSSSVVNDAHETGEMLHMVATAIIPDSKYQPTTTQDE